MTALYVWRIPLELEIPFDFETISSLTEDLSRRAVSGFPQITAASLPGDPGPVLVDLTPESAVALRWASREAFSRDADLVVAYAWQVAPGSLNELAHHGNTRRSQEARADQELQNWVCDVLGPTPPTSVHLHAEHGGPLDTLMTHAVDADLLVLGSRGHHALARLLGGSTSGQLSAHSACPIVVVPPATKFAAC